jgi:hypothetical protein
MIEKSDNEIVDAYIALQHSPEGSPENDNLFWSFEEMLEIVGQEPDRALRIILAILAKDDNAKVVQNLAAGPLEDLLSGYGEEMIGKIENEARENPKFAHLLGGVWRNSIGENIWRKVELLRDRRGWDGVPK